MDCDGCGQPAVLVHKGFDLCEHCKSTCEQWEAVQESKARVEARRKQRQQDYVDSLPPHQRGETQGQLLQAVLDSVRWYETECRSIGDGLGRVRQE